MATKQKPKKSKLTVKHNVPVNKKHPKVNWENLPKMAKQAKKLAKPFTDAVKKKKSELEKIVSKNAKLLEESSISTDLEYKVKKIDVTLPKKWTEEAIKSWHKPNPLLVDMEETFAACLETAKKKNADYAGANEIDPFKNFKNCVFLGVSVEKGILVRMMDKMSRISNLIEQEAQVKDEAIEDTLADLVNYAAILKSYIKQENIKKSITG